MYFVYVLKGAKDRLYVGRTSDINRRWQEHIKRKTWTTSRLGWFELIFYEAFKSKSDAIRRERYLKTSKGKKGLKLILRESLG
jgi:putative endonuclease